MLTKLIVAVKYNLILDDNQMCCLGTGYLNDGFLSKRIVSVYT